MNELREVHSYREVTCPSLHGVGVSECLWEPRSPDSEATDLSTGTPASEMRQHWVSRRPRFGDPLARGAGIRSPEPLESPGVTWSHLDL